MTGHKIEPHRITKPIQLMAVWFVALLLIDTTFLTAAAKIENPSWLSPLLTISAICFVPLFVLGVFLMQTVFRKELQEDPYYSKWLERQEKTFKNFQAEIMAKFPDRPLRNLDATSRENHDELELLRVGKYKEQNGLFLVHSWRPSNFPDQVADIVIWIQQHGVGPLSQGLVEKVEYQLGPKFFKSPLVKTNIEEQFRLEVSAFGPMLCLARIHLKGEQTTILLERYIDFGSAPSRKNY